MSNRVHLIFSSIKEEKPELILGSFKYFTSKAIVVAIKENPQASRKECLLKQFEEAVIKSSNVIEHQLWRHDNRPIELWRNKVIDDLVCKINNKKNNYYENKNIFDYSVYPVSTDRCNKLWKQQR